MAGRMRGVASAIATVGLCVSLGGCSWRWETEPVVTPTADAVIIARDAAALREQAVLDAATASPGATGARRELVAFATRIAASHLSVLGGVYEPFPGATPSPGGPSPQPAMTLDDALIAARDSALNEAFADSESEPGFRSGSIGFTYAFASWWPDAAHDAPESTDGSAVVERALPWAGGSGVFASVPTATALGADDVAALAVLHDQARFIYEVVAARSSDAARSDALARSALHGARAEALVALAGNDSRQPVYELPGVLVDTEVTRAAASRTVEQAVGWRYLELTWGVPAADRTWLMDGAFDAYAASALIPGFALDDFPTLPGTAPAA